MSAINSGTAGKVNMSREELRNIRMVEAFNAAQAKREKRQLQKSARLTAESSSPVPDCCSEAPCFVATERDLMNFTEYLNRLAPAAIEAGIIRISVPLELRDKFMPCAKPAFSDFPCKVQEMRYSSRHEKSGSANLVGHVFGKSPTTTLESMMQRTKKMQSSLGIQDTEVLTPQVMQAEFWKWVQRSSRNKYCIKGLYASDIEFNASQDWKYGSLESLSNHRESLLRHELVGKIAGVNTSMIYVGAAFSFFPWHYEDNMLYSLNYHHEGDSKTWYGISAADAPKYEVVMSKTLFPEIVGKQPHHVWAKSSLVEPSVLAGHGVKIVSCVQNSGDFILTSPGGYHQGFCHGYCFAEALNWAPFSWFPYGMAAAKFYREIAFPASVISTDQLLLSCARELSSNSSDLPLLNAVGNSALALLRSLHSQLQTLIREGIEILKFDPGLISKQNMAIRCDYCQHVCHIAYALFCDPDDPSKETFCCLDHLMHHRSALNLDVSHVRVHLCEDPGRILALMNALSRRLSAITSIEAPVLVRPFPIIEIVDDFILRKSKRKARTARNLDARISDSSPGLQDDLSPILPPSFQHQPFLTALRINHLKEFRVEGPEFFEGSSSIDRMQESMQLEDVNDAVFQKRDRDEGHVEESIHGISLGCTRIHGDGSISLPSSASFADGGLVQESQSNTPKKSRGESLRNKREEYKAHFL